MTRLADHIGDQIDQVTLRRGQPLLLVDADEVLLQFLQSLERHLESEGYFLDLTSFALFGNIKHLDEGHSASREDVAGLLGSFFTDKMHTLTPVPGASDALNNLAAEVQIVVLTNTPGPQRQARADVLRSHGMDFPVVANEGLKGLAAARLAAKANAPVLFMDDIPHNIDSVLDHVDGAHAIHFVADERLRPLIPKAPKAHHRVDEWHLAEPLIRDALLK